MTPQTISNGIRTKEGSKCVIRVEPRMGLHRHGRSALRGSPAGCSQSQRSQRRQLT